MKYKCWICNAELVKNSYNEFICSISDGINPFHHAIERNGVVNRIYIRKYFIFYSNEFIFIEESKNFFGLNYKTLLELKCPLPFEKINTEEKIKKLLMMV